MERPILSVTELNTLVKTLLDEEPLLANIYVRGEISNYKLYPSGHHYFTLKDAESAIRCVMFRGSASTLRFRPENGMKVLALGRVSVYPRDGVYQLYCNEMIADGVGDLHVAFEQLKQKLYAEGLFDAAHKKPLPAYPERIAVVTSSAGAAVHDVIRVLRKRWPMAKVILLPVRVQGVEAPPEIVGAIRYANRWQVADLMIVGRGGGSVEDLWCFNDERVARAIYESEIPVISAVGHEPDVSISDFVADVRAATPSNAAELAVPDQNELLRGLEELRLRMGEIVSGRVQRQSQRLAAIASRRALQDASAFLQDRRQTLDLLQSRLARAEERTLSARRERFRTLAASLDALSPLKVLARGYSVVKDEQGRIIKDSAEVQAGDAVNVKLGRGELRCRVEECRGEEK
ncbi:MAG: exodeoxyribonuclease VII large subunit [Oscillospiraceae bacterium]|nr:exodeoxyribonuclease VII large subunit [Oscillospiraceae bacterium]